MAPTSTIKKIIAKKSRPNKISKPKVLKKIEFDESVRL
jgi:hypothetical protein